MMNGRKQLMVKDANMRKFRETGEDIVSHLLTVIIWFLLNLENLNNSLSYLKITHKIFFTHKQTYLYDMPSANLFPKRA